MAIKQEVIEKLLKEGFPDADIEIQDLAGDDNHFSAKIKSSQFNQLASSTSQPTF